MYNNFMADEKYSLLQKSCQSVKDFVELDMSRQENNYDEREAYYIIKNISYLNIPLVLLYYRNIYLITLFLHCFKFDFSSKSTFI